jgi:MoxR-like ATPase
MNIERPVQPIDDSVLPERLQRNRDAVLTELHKIIIGQEEIIELVMIALFTGGHCLITGVPGLAKTLLIRTLATILDLDFKRIQFTPDLMPADITGIDVIEEDRTTGRRVMKFIKGPLFANVILADEINRTPPKTQAALLEAMQEHHITAGGKRINWRNLFCIGNTEPNRARRNLSFAGSAARPLMFNIVVDYLPEDHEVQVVTATTSNLNPQVQRVISGSEVLALHTLVRKVFVSEEVALYAVRLVRATRPVNKEAPDFVKKWVSWGAGLRASQYLILGGKARALLRGRANVSIKDIQALALPVLRHRVLTNFYAESEKVNSETIIRRLLELVPTPKSGL